MLFGVIVLSWFLRRARLAVRLFSIVPHISTLVAASSSSSMKASRLTLSRSLQVSLGSLNNLCEVPDLDEFLNPVFEGPTIFDVVTIIIMVAVVFGSGDVGLGRDNRRKLKGDIRGKNLLQYSGSIGSQRCIPLLPRPLW